MVKTDTFVLTEITKRTHQLIHIQLLS